MRWWNDALFDTCSLITIDKMLLDDPTLLRFFGKIRAAEVCLRCDNLRPEEVSRIRPRVLLEDPPTLHRLLELILGLSASLSEADKIIYATAVQKRLTVVTGDKALARALVSAGIPVGNVALIIKDLVSSGELSEADCERILLNLENRHDLIIPRPQTWERLRNYNFP